MIKKPETPLLDNFRELSAYYRSRQDAWSDDPVESRRLHTEEQQIIAQVCAQETLISVYERLAIHRLLDDCAYDFLVDSAHDVLEKLLCLNPASYDRDEFPPDSPKVL